MKKEVEAFISDEMLFFLHKCHIYCFKYNSVWFITDFVWKN